MTTTTHTFPNAALAILEGNINLTAALGVLLIDVSSNPYTWNATAQGHTFVSDILAGSGAGALTEVSTSSTGYTRKSLLGMTGSVSGLNADISASNISWMNATFTSVYAFFYEKVHTSDASRRVIAYWDYSSAPVPASNATVQLNLSGGILLQSPVS